MHKVTRILAPLLFVAALHAQQEDYPPGTIQLTPQIDLHLEPVPVVVPEKFRGMVPDNLTLNLPPGFSVKVFAAPGLKGARFMAWHAQGVLHVANMKGPGSSEDKPPANSLIGQILALPDRDHDGVADTVMVVADQLKWVNSLAFYQGEMYVADTGQLLKFRDRDGDGIYEEREVLVGDIPTGGLHITRTILIDESAEKIYLSAGSSCGGPCREDTPERAVLLQFNLDGTGRRVFARGLRNAVGLALHPVTGELWATNNGHDERDKSLPPDWIGIARDGGFYGWPFAYGYQVYIQNGRLHLTHQDSLDVQRMSRPEALIPAHLAPLGIHFYTHDRFPAEYRNAAFIACRAGAGGPAPGYKVIALFSEPDGSNARIGEFMTGFRPDPIQKEVWGKPVGITSDTMGNLYVTSDWGANVILKIVVGRLEGSLEGTLPDSVLVGTPFDIDAVLHLRGLAPEGGTPKVTADLSALGGPAALPLVAEGKETYRLKASLVVEHTGAKNFTVRMEQQTPFDLLTSVLRHAIRVFPKEDLLILGNALAASWLTEIWYGDLEFPSASTSDPAYEGSAAVAIRSPRGGTVGQGWNFVLQPDAPVGDLGYRALTFAFHPGDVAAAADAELAVALRPGRSIDLLATGQVRLKERTWQHLEIPLDTFALDGQIEAVQFQGNLKGEFYLADMRLIASSPSPTAVLEEPHTAPSAFSLEQNYPNPFNSTTAIRFSLSQRTLVKLAVYNLTGQQVASLEERLREAGAYTLSWNGRDDQGHDLASGVYLYRLRAGAQVETRRLVLVR